VRATAVLGPRESNPDHRLHPWDLAQAAEGPDLPPPAALDAADLVVHRLVAVGADRDDELLGAHAHDLARGADDLVGQVAVGREVEEDEVLAVGDDRLADLDEVLAERDLAAREVDPQEAWRALEEAADLIQAQ